MNIKPDELKDAVNDILQTFAKATADEVAKATKETAEKAAQITRQAAAEEYGSHYANAIRARHFKDIAKNGGREISEYVTAGRRYRIAHLLEHGHALVRGGRTIKQVEGHEHFAKGEDYVERNYVPNVKKAIEEASK